MPTSRKSRAEGRRRIGGRGLVLVCAACAAVWAQAPALAHGAVPDPERNATTPVSWHWYNGISPSDLATKINQSGERIVSLQVESTSPIRFTAALVKNAGVYQRGWWWYYDQTAAQLNQHLADNNGRLIDLDTYTDNGTRYFAAVMVPNSGQAAKSWWWYYGLNASQVSQHLTDHEARLTDIEAYGPSNSPQFAVVMIPNSGVDAKNWHWYYNQSEAGVTAKLSQYSSRPIDIERQGDNLYTVVMVRSDGDFGDWATDRTAQDLDNYAAQNGSRLIDIEPYFVNGAKRFAGAMIDNVNAESGRLRSILRPGLNSGFFGVYLRRVDGPVFAGLAENKIFEPASALKALPEVYALRQVELGNADLDTPNWITYHSCPGSPNPGDSGSCSGQQVASNICPANDLAPATYQTTLRNAISLMMTISDNRMTRGIIERFGFGRDLYGTGAAAMDSWADAHGIGAQTQIRQIFGCGFRNGLRNDWSLIDAAKLYAGVINGDLLKTNGEQTQFFTFQNYQSGYGNPQMYDIIKNEAAKLGKSSIAKQFAQAVTWRGKGGSYDIGCSSGCTYRYYRSAADRFVVPYKVNTPSGTQTKLRFFVGGFFANDVPIYCSSTTTCPSIQAADHSVDLIEEERFRSAVRAALKSWPAAAGS